VDSTGHGSYNDFIRDIELEMAEKSKISFGPKSIKSSLLIATKW
jgi:hypothetical protein